MGANTFPVFGLPQFEQVFGKLDKDRNGPLCARHGTKCFPYVNLFNPHCSPIRQVLSSFPSYTWELRSSRRSDLPTTISWDPNPGAVLCFHVWQYGGLDNLKTLAINHLETPEKYNNHPFKYAAGHRKVRSPRPKPMENKSMAHKSQCFTYSRDAANLGIQGY